MSRKRKIGTTKTVKPEVRSSKEKQFLTEIEKLIELYSDDLSASLMVSLEEISQSASIHKRLNEIEQQIKKTNSIARRMQQQQDENIEKNLLNFLPSKFFIKRLNNRVIEKKSISEFVVSHYFEKRNPPLRYFVQASSTAYHLGVRLGKITEPTHNCLIHTNSVVMPLAILFGPGIHRPAVWAFSNHTFDTSCAGWLIPENDKQSFEELKRLFVRNDDPLTTAFLMPMFITTDAGVFYERRDTALFTDVLGEANEIVILATGDRILESGNDVPIDNHYEPSLQGIWKNSLAKVTLVVSQPDTPIPPIASQYRDLGMKVFWQSKDGWFRLHDVSAE